MLRVLRGALELNRVALGEEALALGPHLGGGATQHGLLDLGELGGGDGLEGVVLAPEAVELVAALGEHRAALEHLDFHALLEHVGGRRHAHVGRLGDGEHVAHHVGRSRLHAGLVHGAGEHVGRTHREGGGGGRGRGDAAGQTDTRRDGVAVLGLDAVAQGEQQRQQHRGRSVVGVAARVGLSGEVFGHGNARGEAGFGGGEASGGHELFQHLRWGRAQELDGHLFSGDLGHYVVAANHGAVGGLGEAGGGVLHEGGRELHEGGGRHAGHAALQVEVDGGLLVTGLLRAVDQVEAVGKVAHSGLNRGDGPVDALEREARRAKEAQHAGLRHRDDEVGARDAVRHRAGNVFHPHPVGLLEARVAEHVGGERWNPGEQRQRRTRSWPSGQDHICVCRDCRAVGGGRECKPPVELLKR